MHVALGSAQASTGSSLGITGLLVLTVALLVAWPLFRKFRKSVSADRKRRWVEQGLMDPPSADPPGAGPESTERSE
jgi:hypothetical protein